jgi:hypothetical protein
MSLTMMAVSLMPALMRRIPASLLQMFFHFRFVEFVSLTFYDSDCILRTLAKTGAKTVAKIIRRKHGLAVDHFYCAFST